MPDFECAGCGHTWQARVANPQKCPKCQRLRRKQIPDSLRFSVFERDDFTCQECEFNAGNGSKGLLHAHHVIPRSENGPDTLENLKTLCVGCHWRAHAFIGPRKPRSGFKSKTYSLSDEVVAWIEELRAGHGSPNRGLLWVMENCGPLSSMDLELIDLETRRTKALSMGYPSNAYICAGCLAEGKTEGSATYLDWPAMYSNGECFCSRHAAANMEHTLPPNQE